ncbi:carbamoyltransferase [Sorangium cellulosum]|uniref:Carbamoyltransferase n=1 Tax=Sorangium cellulosum TaxID=56 RepID=A0A4P2PXS6_SORCE|nr:carbamoyltransferase C-terminal domain-containing protein [Sorangium cellulosum]AUX21637.1 carbamoyltransferase [Sorangium cellulosum]
MLILGINAYHGDASAALLVDGQLVAAAEEERFSRIKHCAGFPRLAVEYCLEAAGARVEDIDHIALGRDPRAHLGDRLLYAMTRRSPAGLLKGALGARDPKVHLGAALGVDPRRLRAVSHNVEHHRAHLASAFFPSGFDEAAVVSIDAFGDFVSTMWARGRGNKLEILRRVGFPHSLGLFYSGMTQYLGFPKFGDEYKVMGLAAHGQPELLDKLRQVVRVKDGAFELGLEYFQHHTKGISMTWEGEPRYGAIHSGLLVDLLGPARSPKSRMEDRFTAIAASTQAVFEEVFFEVLATAKHLTGASRLALAGGCAYNSLAAGKIQPKGLFEDVFIQPAAGDAGTAVGAALYVYHHKLDRPRRFHQTHSYFGPAFSQDTIEALLRQEQVPFETLADEDLIARVARAIGEGKIVGWFQGRMEWGPRALGNRSILCDPRRPDIKDIMNERIKRREMFRPFAPALPLERMGDYVEQPAPDPFMVKVSRIRPERRAEIPAVTHVDGTGRVQTVTARENPRFHALLLEFGRLTGTPVLLNTSFNASEPIVCTPKEALDCFLRTKMDVLVLEQAYLERGRVPGHDAGGAAAP